ncbi:hypothetical protein K503DRAFT_860231 [Rhizopogon vinicolor AM-OR11-026]|uniref:Cytochrome P450 n=1 Tax=Rhizopogon vinicolor AM-OR11-026 TaxID=1314800 RepID=A0A1B7MJ38_9AGAM|nr:hypothetical protein K503DRAFT_860231 [Rhizopogon vinicolor AM-OR11-026]
MLQLPDLYISDNPQLVLGAAACLGVVAGVITQAYLPRSERTEKIVIIGRYKAMVDIMEKQGGILADRPRVIAAGELLAGGLSIGFAHAGERFRRRMRSLTYQPLQMSHAKRTVLDDSHNFLNHAGTYAATTIMKFAYGKDTPTSATDPDVRGSPLKHLLWYGRELKRGFESIEPAKQQISNTDIDPSFAKHVLENGHSYGITEIEAAFLAGAFFQLDPPWYQSSVEICAILMAAACFPEEQAKVQAELDAVIGLLEFRGCTNDERRNYVGRC